MRINRYVALATGMSRRKADEVIASGSILVDGKPAQAGMLVSDQDTVTYQGTILSLPDTTTTIILNKPVGYVCSRTGQGSKTIYELLPVKLHSLKPIGRLDKDSSGLLLLTDDGQLAQQLTHPRFYKVKRYEVTVSKPLTPLHRQMISDFGIQLHDGISKLLLERQKDGSDIDWNITMHEGRNRQIRRTFEALGYAVTRLHRIQFDNYTLGNLKSGAWLKLDNTSS